MEDMTGTCNKVLEQTSAILKLATNRIYASVSKDENIGITALSEAIGNELCHEKTFVYGVIGAYVDTNPELVCAKGKGGGIMLKSKYDTIQQKQEKIKEEKTFSRFTVTVREAGFKTKQQFDSARRELGEHPTLSVLKEWIAKKNGAV